jgi:hypothetical protein
MPFQAEQVVDCPHVGMQSYIFAGQMGYPAISPYRTPHLNLILRFLKPISIAIIMCMWRETARNFTSLINLLISLPNLLKSQIINYPNVKTDVQNKEGFGCHSPPMEHCLSQSVSCLTSPVYTHFPIWHVPVHTILGRSRSYRRTSPRLPRARSRQGFLPGHPLAGYRWYSVSPVDRRFFRCCCNSLLRRLVAIGHTDLWLPDCY